MFEFLDLYCERTAYGWLAEPFNLATNLAYFVAAWFALADAHRRGAVTVSTRLLLILLCAVGFGSAAFHAAANRLAQFLDELPIVLFQVAFLWAYCRDVARWPVSRATLVSASLLAAVLLSSRFAGAYNGSLAYVPALVFLSGIAVYHSMTDRARRHAMMMAVVVFTTSLAFRTVDIAVCERFSRGTHFLWHIGTALTLYLVMAGYLANLRFGHRP